MLLVGDLLSQERTFEWFKRLKDSRKSVQDDKHSDRQSSCTTKKTTTKMREVTLEDRQQTIVLKCHTGHVDSL